MSTATQPVAFPSVTTPPSPVGSAATLPKTPELALDWKSSYPPEAMRQIRGEGIYLGCVLLLAVAVGAILIGLRERLATHAVTQELLFCALGGITGSWIYSIRWFVRVLAEKIWRRDLLAWRLSAPFMGIFTAVSAYAAMKAGLLGITLIDTADVRFSAYAIGFLMGLFTDELMKKLTEVAQTLFGKSAPTKHPKTA